MTDTPNQVTPRQLAVAAIADAAAEARARADLYADQHDMTDYEHSRIWVFLRRVAELITRAERLLLDDPDPGE